MQLWLDFGKAIPRSDLEERLIELVKIRASQLDGCAVCLHMHTTSARKLGETEERLYLLDPGVNLRSIASANAPHWLGPKL